MHNRDWLVAKCVLVVAAVLMLPRMASAQDNSAEAGGSQDGAELSMSEQLSVVLDEVNFSGGNVGDYVGQIRDLSQGRAKLNIIVREDASRLNLPSIELRQVAIGTALHAMSAATADRVRIETTGGNNGDSYVMVTREFGPDDPADMVVLNVQPILQNFPKEKLEAVFAVGMQMLESEDLQLKLHEESGLLFAKGTPKALSMIQSAVDELSRGIGSAGPFGAPRIIENAEK